MEIVIGKIKASFEKSGHGAPLLIVHGWGGSKASLSALQQSLSQQFCCYSVDLPGFGETPAPAGVWGVDEYAEFLVDFMKLLKIEQPVYFGHSFGGGLGIYLALKNPQIFSALLLCAPAYRRNAKEAKSVRILKRLWPAYEDIKENPLVRKVRLLYYKIFYPLSDTLKNPQLEKSFRKIITEDLSENLEQIHVPTFIMWGDQDRYTPIGNSDLLTAKIAGSKLKIYPGFGHGLPLKAPGLLGADILNFYKSLTTK